MQAYLLWRLSRLEDLKTLLVSLPSSFHQESDFWLYIALLCKNDSPARAEAELAYKYAIQLAPERSDLYYNLANLVKTSSSSRALTYYILSLEIDPCQPHCWHNLALSLQDLNLFEVSIRSFKSAILLDPINIDVYNNLGLFYLSLERFESAEISFLCAISLNPNESKSLVNLGALLLACRSFELASIRFENALELDPQCSSALFNLGLCHLALGRFDTGWKYYQERLQTHCVPLHCWPTLGPVLSSLKQLFVVDSPPLIVWCEQGLGDTIQFSRYLILLHSLGISFKFFCQRELIDLMRRWFPIPLDIYPLLSRSDTIQRLHCPLLSLPFIFSSDESSIPVSLPYFRNPSPSSPELLIPTPPGGLSVGLVWSSNPHNARMHKNKSIPLSFLMPLLLNLIDLDLIDLHCLQCGESQKELLPWINHARITDWSSHLTDFAKTATLIDQFDLVISVDTAVAHLSASLNCPTWLLLPWDSDFRWLRHRTDSPWYPETMRLFRQTSRYDWPGVVSSVHEAFERLFLVDLDKLVSLKLLR